jgi:hypothetical protein
MGVRLGMLKFLTLNSNTIKTVLDIDSILFTVKLFNIGTK